MVDKGLIKGVIIQLGPKADFVNRGGNGSQRNVVCPMARNPVTISGKLGGDAKHHQSEQ